MNGSIMHLHVKVKAIHGDGVEPEDIVSDMGYHFNSNTDCAKVVETEIVELTGVQGLYNPEDYFDFESEAPYDDPDPERDLDAAVGLLQALRSGQYEDSIWPEVDEFLRDHGVEVES